MTNINGKQVGSWITDGESHQLKAGKQVGDKNGYKTYQEAVLAAKDTGMSDDVITYNENTKMFYVNDLVETGYWDTDFTEDNADNDEFKFKSVSDSIKVISFIGDDDSTVAIDKAALKRIQNNNPDANIFDLPGFKEGDSLEVDGPLSADGTGKIKKFDKDNLEISLKVYVPDSILGKEIYVPYQKDSNKNINISLKLEKNGNSDYQFTLKDNNSSSAGIAFPAKVDKDGDTIRIEAGGEKFSITVEGNGRINIDSDEIPGSFTVTN